MSGINFKLLIVTVVTISILLMAGALLVNTLNPVKTPPSPTPTPSPTVNTSQSTNEPPTNVQEAPVPAAIQPAEGGSPATAESGTTPAGGTEPKSAISPKPVRIP